MLALRLDEASRRDAKDGMPAEECGWGAGRRHRRRAWRGEKADRRLARGPTTALALSHVKGAPALLARRAEGHELRLSRESARRPGSLVALETAPSSSMTALERPLHASPPEGLVNLTNGYPEGQNLEWIEQIVRTPFVRGETRGEHRRNVEAHFRRLFGLEDVLLTATASEVLLIAIRTAVSAGGNEVVILESGFDAYPGLIETCGAVPRFAARPADGHLSPAAVFDEIGVRTAAVLIDSPENPTA